MDFEIEFLPVGDGSKAGDAIVARYGSNGQYAVTVIDGGTQDSGDALVDHIKSHYGERTVVDHVISTHPDNDHASGLRRVLGKLPVNSLWLHGLWHHSSDLLPFFADKQLTPDKLQQKIKAEYPIVEELIALARAQGTPVYEPFEAAQIGPFTVLSPTRYAYDRLVAQFRRTPEPDKPLLESQNFYLDVAKQSILASLIETVTKKVMQWIDERWDIELLKDGGTTAAENESSVVLWGDFGSAKVLLTGDAGVNALTWACDYAVSRGIDVQTAKLVQVPHHGSRSNVGPTLLDRILGPKTAAGCGKRYGIVSAPKDDENHPRKMVMNACLRRSTPVYKTQGQTFRYHSGTMPARANESPAEPFGFFGKVEAYD
jgi:beta-lactamase superfamily II metal-dependent hydrolase